MAFKIAGALPCLLDIWRSEAPKNAMPPSHESTDLVVGQTVAPDAPLCVVVRLEYSTAADDALASPETVQLLRMQPLLRREAGEGRQTGPVPRKVDQQLALTAWERVAAAVATSISVYPCLQRRRIVVQVFQHRAGVALLPG